MTTPRETSEALPDLAGWARRKLAVGENLTPTAGHARILRDLATASLVPSTDWHEAFEIIYRPARGCYRSGRGLWDEEARLRNDVEAFATEFFRLEPLIRRDRWETLAGECQAFPRLAARLECLRPGLDVAVAPVSPKEDQLRWLVEHATELFILRPPERAARRQTLLAELGDKASTLEGATRQLQKRFPELAALEPNLIGRLATWSKIEKSVRKAAKRQGGGTSGTSRSGAGLTWVGVLVAMVLLRGLSYLSHTSTPTNYIAPSYSAPQSNSWNAGRVGVPQNRPNSLAPQVPSWPNNRPSGPTSVQTDPWNTGLPVPFGAEHPSQTRPGAMPVPMPGEPSYQYSQRIAEWARRQSKPFAPLAPNRGMRHQRGENPASPQNGVNPSSAPDFNPWERHPRPASPSASNERS
jgi:hypothetical protein